MERNPKIEFLKQMEHIQQVEAPDFMLTRIEQRIKNAESEKVSTLKFSLVTLSLIVLLLINVIGIRMYKNNSEVNLLEQMNMDSNYNLYP
jgi:hypothetical protein